MVTKSELENAPYYEINNLPVFTSTVEGEQCDLLAIGVVEEDVETKDDVKSIATEALQSLDQNLTGIVTEAVEVHDFTPKKGATTCLRVGSSVRFVLLVGLGPASGLQASVWGPSPFVQLGSAITSTAKSIKAKLVRVALTRDIASFAGFYPQQVASGVINGLYDAVAFKSESKKPTLERVVLPGVADDVLESAVARAAGLARGTAYARHLVDAPPNVCTPGYLANAAVAIAEKFPDVMSCKVLEKADCEEMGMGCYLGVAACSDLPPKFIHLTYTPKTNAESARKVALVGKGITFDSGGYNLKAGAGSMIELMKFDMGGAAAVFGAARAIAELQPEGVEVHFVSASCENMVDGKGMRPGDILSSASGKTVEIINTDAEGRLSLCDALWYVQEKVGVTKCMDIATLTGAAIVALGESIAAVMTPEDAIAEEVVSSGKLCGERYWRLPLEESYADQLKSSCADTTNLGKSKMGGSIHAGLFLKLFVDTQKMQWVHVDMPGPGWNWKESLATGFGAATLALWVENCCQ